MIILDEDDDSQLPKNPADPSDAVIRPTTPTPSLPDYEASQAQHEQQDREPDEGQSRPEERHRRWWRKRSKYRFRRAAIIALIVYFFFTVAVGVPIIAVKLRHKYLEHQSLPPRVGSTTSSSSSLIVMDDDEDVFLASAVACNSWSEAWPERSNANSGLTRIDLQYPIPLNGTLFVQSNVSYQAASTELGAVSGSLTVDLNEDSSVDDAVVSVSMLYSDTRLVDRTNVCLMNVSGSSHGLYIYVPSNSSSKDTLIFNITLLLPQTPSLYIRDFITMLPHFYQYFAPVSPQVTFGEIQIGGPLSTIVAEGLTAQTISVKSALAPISGSFRASNSLVLDTVSAPITADISLYNSGASKETTFLQVNTGNCPLEANLTLFLNPNAGPPTKVPNFVAKVQTFNAPLMWNVKHDSSSPPSLTRLRAENNLAQAIVSVDSKFTGTFDVSTTFAESNVALVDLSGPSTPVFDQAMYIVASPVASASAASETTRRLDFDVLSGSSMLGWVGTGIRPPEPKRFPFGHQGRIELVSSLSPVTLFLGS